MSEVITEILEMIETTVVDEIIEHGFVGESGRDGLDASGAIAPINFSFGDAAQIIFTPSVAVLVTGINIVIETAFNGSSSTIFLGTTATPDLFETSIYCDANERGDYEIPLNEILSAGTGIRLAINLGVGCTQGNGKILINAVAVN